MSFGKRERAWARRARRLMKDQDVCEGSGRSAENFLAEHGGSSAEEAWAALGDIEIAAWVVEQLGISPPHSGTEDRKDCWCGNIRLLNAQVSAEKVEQALRGMYP